MSTPNVSTGTPQIRVVVVDDDALVRKAVAMILGTAPDITVVGQAGDGREGLAVIREHRPDVVLTDIRMPVMDGLALIGELAAAADPTPVLALTTFNTDEYVVRAFALGAKGFLLKDADPAEMVGAIRAVHAGLPALSPGATQTLIDAVSSAAATATAPSTHLTDALTEREREVAVLLTAGYTNAEIGEKLFMALATVKANVTRIFTKLGVDNRVSAAMIIRDEGLL